MSSHQNNDTVTYTEDISHLQVYEYVQPIQTNVWKKTKELAKSYVLLFLATSSIHGFNHIIAPRRHPFEMFLWLLLVILSIYGTVYLSSTTWVRYQSSPTMVSMERDMFAWNTTFPCVTLCPEKKLDPRKLDEYVASSPEPDKEKLEAFIMNLSVATYDNFHELPDYHGIPAENFMELLLNLSAFFEPSLTIGASGIHLDIEPTITELGLCYAVNSKVAVFNSPSYRMKNRWDFVKSRNDSFFVHPLDGEVFAQIINMSTSYSVFIHGPQEVPDIASRRQYSSEDFYMKLYVTALTVYTSPAAAKLKWAQRGCRFPEENNLRHNAVYTYNTCRMECRIRLCFDMCGCIPYFYRRIGNERVCDVKGMKCLSKFKDMLYKLQDENGRKLKCDCNPNCDDVNYVIQSYVLQPWFLGTNLQWGIVTYPRMRYRRDVIFGFTDVLVSVGGMAGLFLGCSVLSFMEIVYFLTLRLWSYVRYDCSRVELHSKNK